MQIAGTNNQKLSVFVCTSSTPPGQKLFTTRAQCGNYLLFHSALTWKTPSVTSLFCGWWDGGPFAAFNSNVTLPGIWIWWKSRELYKVNSANSSLYGGRGCVIPHPMICEWGKYWPGILSCNFSAGQGLHFAGWGAHPWNIVLEFSGKNSSHPAGKCWAGVLQWDLSCWKHIFSFWMGVLLLHEVGIISECIDLSCTSFNIPYLYFVHVYTACLVPTEMSVFL